MPIPEKHFSTMAEYLAYAEENAAPGYSSTRPGDRTFMGTGSLEEAVKLAKVGWPEGSKQFKETVTTLRDHLKRIMAEKRKTVSHPAGGRVDVAAYLAGSPMVFRRRQPSPAPKPLVKIGVNIGCSGAATQTPIFNRGAAVAVLTSCLEAAGYKVAVTAYRANTISRHSWPLKLATGVLDLDKLAFNLCSPATNRRLGWAVCEGLAGAPNASYNAYGAPDYWPNLEETFDVNLNSGKGALDEWMDDESVARWVLKQLEELGAA